MNISGSYIKGVLLVLLSALCFSISGTLQALAPEGSNPFIITEMRMIIGALFLYFWCRAFKKLPHSYKDLPWKSLFICAIFLLIVQLCFFTGMANIGVAAGAVISIGSAPIFAAIISRIFFKISPPKAWYAATFLAIAGVALINGGDLNQSRLFFILILLTDGLTYAAYINFSSKIGDKLDSDAAVMLILAIIAEALSPVLFIFPISWTYSSLNGILVCLGLGIFTGGMAFAFLTSGARLVSPAVASTLCLAEPLGAVCWGIFLLKEDASFTTLLGITSVLLSIIVLVFFAKKTKKPSNPKAQEIPQIQSSSTITDV